jgi:cytochrome c oxidase cbb3-type subunit IV
MQLTLHTIWTVLALAVFIGIIIWAYSPARKQRFDEAARLALEEPLTDNESMPGSRAND